MCDVLYLDILLDTFQYQISMDILVVLCIKYINIIKYP